MYIAMCVYERSNEYLGKSFSLDIATTRMIEDILKTLEEEITPENIQKIKDGGYNNENFEFNGDSAWLNSKGDTDWFIIDENDVPEIIVSDSPENEVP